MKANTNKYEVKVITKKGEQILIDAEDFDKVKKYCWCISKTGYPVANVKGKVTKLHRYILELSNPNIIVDHKNRNKLDNRKTNLRICTILENSRNTTKSKNNKTEYLGISFAGKNKFRARIMVNGKKIRLGHYEKIEDAIKARKEAELKYFGDYAPHLN